MEKRDREQFKGHITKQTNMELFKKANIKLEI